MHRLIGKFVLAVIMTAVSSMAVAANFTLDPSHSEIGFSVRHLMITNVKGKFNKYEGKFVFDEKSGNLSNVDVMIDPKSIDTNDDKRDEHLRSPDFFDATKYSKITFKGDKVEIKTGKPVKITGTLTMRGVAKPVSLDIDYRGLQVDPWGNEKIGFGLTGKLNRKDWGISWNKALDKGGVTVSDEVAVNIEGEALKEKAK